MTVEELRQQRYELANRMRAISNTAEEEDRGLSSDEESQRQNMITEYDALSARIERMEEDEERVTALEVVHRDSRLVPGGDDEDASDEERAQARYADVFGRYLRTGQGELDPEERQILRTGAVQLGQAEQRALGAGGTGAAGGFGVPESFLDLLVETRAHFGGMREVADSIQTESGEDMPFPTMDDTGNEGAILSENSQIGEQDPALGNKTLRAYVYTSKLVRISWVLLNDNRINLEGRLAGIFGKRLGRIHNRHFTLGTGSGQPQGFVTVATVGKALATGQTVTFLYTDLIDLEHSVDRDYREGGRYMMSDQALLVAKKLLDGNSRPIWLPSAREGDPQTLNGYAVTVNSNMAAPAASAKSVAFGDFSAYLIRDVASAQVVRLEERYADFLQVGFFAFDRTDGLLTDTAALKVMQHSAS